MSRKQDQNWQRNRGPASSGSLALYTSRPASPTTNTGTKTLGEGASLSGVTVFTSTGIPGVSINPTMNLLPYI